MLKRLSASTRLFDGKVGISRFGALVSLAIIIVAAVVLYRVLRDIDPNGLLEALKATNWRTIAMSGMFVAAGYLTLTLYDLFALRTIGRREIPYRVAALASFTSYSVGHNVGASVFSGGAVRYRIYSSWGLSVLRSYQNLLRGRAHVLARKRHRARTWHPRCAAAGHRDRSIAALGQPRAGADHPWHAGRLHRLGLGEAAGHRP